MTSAGLRHCLWSGTLAATASVFGKLAMSPSDNFEWHPMTRMSYRAVMLALMVVVNGLMWTQFTKALKLYTNSLQVIIINTSTNFFVTALFGKLLFREELSIVWWMGSSLIVIGLLIMKGSDGEKQNQSKLKSN